MKGAAKQIGIGALVLLVFCAVCRFFLFRDFTAYLPLPPAVADSPRAEGIRAEPEEPGIIRAGVPEVRNGAVSVKVSPEGPGTTFLVVRNAGGEPLGYIRFTVNRFGMLYEGNTGGFNGDTVVILAAAAFWFLAGAVACWNFFRRKGPAFYHHYTVYFAGFSLFACLTGACLLETSLRHLFSPAGHSMLYVYSALSGASVRFIALTSPLFLAFAAAMAVSNVVLLRHSRFRLQNVLGLLVSGLLAAGLLGELYLATRDFMGSEWEGRVRSTLENTYATAFVYFECILAGAAVCGVRAAKRRPAMDKDFIVILGCWFRKDGTLPPLLRDRVERALSFWQAQKEATGKEACFIPSGGRGPDEPMPEAEAMRRYLLSRDVPDRLIRPETASKNTLENMKFSGEIIRETNPEGKTVFATTNYHVFRSGVWASMAGLPAEGIGSRCRWWFWPNAFMRETVGLLAKRWKQELVMLILLAAWFAALTLLVG